MLHILGTCVRESKRNLVFLFVFCSLNRTSDASHLRYLRSRIQKEIWYFFLYSAHLIVPLMLRILGTYVRESKRNLVFLFVFCSLNRTFAL